MDADKTIINQSRWCAWGAPWRYPVDERFVQIWEMVKEFKMFWDDILQSDKWYFCPRMGFIKYQRCEHGFRKEVRWFVLRYKQPYICFPSGPLLSEVSSIWWHLSGTPFPIGTSSPEDVPQPSTSSSYAGMTGPCATHAQCHMESQPMMPRWYPLPN